MMLADILRLFPRKEERFGRNLADGWQTCKENRNEIFGRIPQMNLVYFEF